MNEGQEDKQVFPEVVPVRGREHKERVKEVEYDVFCIHI
jgi:hypothetical protein